MQRHWVLVADAVHARILASNGNILKAKQVETFENPKGRLKVSELVTDKPARSVGGGSGGHLAGPEVDAHEHVLQEFARSLAKALAAGRAAGSFEKLTLVAPPHLLGLIKGSLDAPTGKLLNQTIPKDFSKATTPDLLEHLEKLLD